MNKVTVVYIKVMYDLVIMSFALFSLRYNFFPSIFYRYVEDMLISLFKTTGKLEALFFKLNTILTDTVFQATLISKMCLNI